MMGELTGISWTDGTFNPWWGCTKVSPGCVSCYAEAFDKRVGGEHWGKGAPRRVFGEKHWNEPLKWNKKAGSEGKITKVFCGSMCDIMDEEAPDGERFRLWSLINRTPNILWQLLTKRPHHYKEYLPTSGFAYDNVILGSTAEAQPQYDNRIYDLCHAAEWLTEKNNYFGGYDGIPSIRKPVQTFISYEPAIGPLTMVNRLKPSWLICGGESGYNRREFKLNWAENIYSECQVFGVSFFMKQMSATNPTKASELIPLHMLIRQFPD